MFESLTVLRSMFWVWWLMNTKHKTKNPTNLHFLKHSTKTNQTASMAIITNCNCCFVHLRLLFTYYEAI